ncbi:MAG: hypothetical protein K2F86_02115 [Duncaniella sp.]|nr:hypothetical protein [Duncaniella sp.]
MTKQKQLPHHTAEFQGYTMDELRYHRAYSAARVEINRSRLHERIASLRKNGFRPKGTPGGVVGRLIGAFSYIDLGIMAWKIGSQTFRIFRRLRR